MKIKQLFHQSVRGTNMFRALVDIYGLRMAIKEVNRVIRSTKCKDATAHRKNADKYDELCTWDNSPQGADFWINVMNFMRNTKRNGGR